MSNPNLCIHCGYPIDIATLNPPASLICPNCLKPLSQTAEKLVKEGIDPDLIAPFYSDDELKEIGCIGYHIDEMEGLVGRNLVTDEVFQIVSNEQNERLKDLNRLGRAERAIQMAQQCSVSSRFRPLSINWAEAACRLAPDRLDFWEKAIHFATQHEELETATRLCHDATQTYGHSELVGRLAVIENLIRKKEQTDFTRSQLQSARHSLSSGDYTTAAESAKSIIKLNPYSNEAWDLLTTALEKSGLYREALKAISDCQNQFSGRIPMEQMGRADRIKKLLDNSVNPAAPMTTPTSVSQYKSRLGRMPLS
jgi:tetratricopeptide (TPR) repeat protein